MSTKNLHLHSIRRHARTATYLICGELVVELPDARDDMPGNCGRDADVDVELGRDMGSNVGGG
jgi:hypothetical protein